MYQFKDIDPGQGGGAAALGQPSFFRASAFRASVGQSGTAPQTATTPASRIPGNAADRLAALAASLDQLDLVQDLGLRIGSREWLRGAATCFALCYAAWSFAPGLEPVAGAATPVLPEAQWEEARALSIAPLAYGADTGRRMAPTDIVVPLSDTPERPSLELTATIGRGMSFSRVLQRSGVAASDAEAAAKLVGDDVPLDELKPGTTMDVVLGRRPNKNVSRPLELLTLRARFDLRLEVKRVDGALTLKRIRIAVDDTPLRIQGRVGASLYRSARAAGAPAKAVEAYLRAIATKTSIGGIGADDRFDIIVEHRRAETGETESGKLLYAGLDRASGKDLQLMQWEQGERTQWFEASGVGRSSGSLQRPVPGRVTSNFGMRRHPILGYSRMHKGMDFRAGHGTPILAATDGKVASAGWAGGYGRQVKVRHAGGLMTSYSHMSRIVAKPGARVKQGQVIGYVGSSGLSTGPHLHYEMYKNGRAVNPASVKFVGNAQLSGSELASFKRKLRNLLAVPAGAPRNEEQMAKRDTKAPAKS